MTAKRTEQDTQPLQAGILTQAASRGETLWKKRSTRVAAAARFGIRAQPCQSASGRTMNYVIIGVRLLRLCPCGAPWSGKTRQETCSC